MKKYDSPICEIEFALMSDIITLSYYDSVDLDKETGIDKIYW